MLLSRLVGFVCERNAHALVMADSGVAANKSSTHTDLTTSALMILSEINRKYPSEMKYNGLQIMVKIYEDEKSFFFQVKMNFILVYSGSLIIQVISHWVNFGW